jgi:hypothetical protein
MIFVDKTTKVQAIKAKINTWGLHQTKTVLHTKGNNPQNEKAIYIIGDICEP